MTCSFQGSTCFMDCAGCPHDQSGPRAELVGGLMAERDAAQSRALAAEERVKRMEVELLGVLGAAESLLSPDSSTVDIERLRTRVNEARAALAASETPGAATADRDGICPRCEGCHRWACGTAACADFKPKAALAASEAEAPAREPKP